MKGVIMAGGKGTRLRPLTCNLPKPMVPIINKPVMQYSIELLRKHGITDIAVTVQYLPDAIRDYFGDGCEFGVNLTYFEETTPLGTAGSVKQAEHFLDEPFVVVSGDALTDFDLEEAIEFHHQKKGLVTILMKQVDDPLEFGVIMTNEEDEIVRFLEKPSWSEVFSDTVNTGIYVMEPEVLSYIKQDTVTDFSKDIFPTLLEKRAGLFGYQASGYWSDIGNIKQYSQAQIDLLNGAVEAKLHGTEIEDGIWIGDYVVIEEGASIEGPVAIGDNTIIRAGAFIGPHTVIGSNAVVSKDASLKRSVLWDGNYIGDDSELRGVTVTDNITIGSKSSLYEDVVVGHNSFIGIGTIVQPGVKVWPYKQIDSDQIVSESVMWEGKGTVQSVLQGHRACGTANVEMTTEFASKLGLAFGSLRHLDATIFVASDDHSFSNMMKQSIIQSLQATGVHVIEQSEMMIPLFRYAIEKQKVQGGVYLRLSNRNNEKQMIVEFFDGEGLPISVTEQRELEKALAFRSFRYAAFDYAGTYKKDFETKDQYINELLQQVNSERIKERKWRVAVHMDSKEQSVLPALLKQLHCEVLFVPTQSNFETLKQIIVDHELDIGFMIGESGEFLSLMNEEGRLITEEEQLTLLTFLQLEKGLRPKLAIPLYGGSALEEVAASYETELIRTKASRREMMMTEGTVQMMAYDAPFALLQILDFMSENSLSLTGVMKDLPYQLVYKEEVDCRTEQKGFIMRKLMELLKSKEVELHEGMKVRGQRGEWTFIIPDQEKPAFTVYAESENIEQAKKMAGEYVEQINRFKQQPSTQ